MDGFWVNDAWIKCEKRKQYDKRTGLPICDDCGTLISEEEANENNWRCDNCINKKIDNVEDYPNYKEEDSMIRYNEITRPEQEW